MFIILIPQQTGTNYLSDMIDWLYENASPAANGWEYVGVNRDDGYKFMFKEQNDAIKFKLIWG